MEQKSNFTFLENKFPELFVLANDAERYLETDANVSLFKCRQIQEQITCILINYFERGNIASSNFVMHDIVKKLKSSLPWEHYPTLFLIYDIRKKANKAVHLEGEDVFTPRNKLEEYEEAKNVLKKIHKLSINFIYIISKEKIEKKEFVFFPKPIDQLKLKEQELLEKNSALEKYELEIKELHKQNLLKQKQIEDLNNNSQEYQNKIKNLSDEKKEIQSSIDSLKIKEQELLEKQSEVENYKAVTSKLHSQILQKQKEIETINLSSQEYEEKVSRLSKEKESMQASTYSLREKENTLLNEINQKNKEIETLKKKEEAFQQSKIDLNKLEILHQEQLKKILESKAIEVEETKKAIRKEYVIIPLVLFAAMYFLSTIQNEETKMKKSIVTETKQEVESKITEDSFSSDQGIMDWYRIYEKCKALKMRLPTSDEIGEAHRLGITKTWRPGRYWTNTNSEKNSAMYLDTVDGYLYGGFKDILKLRSRCFID